MAEITSLGCLKTFNNTSMPISPSPSVAHGGLLCELKTASYFNIQMNSISIQSRTFHHFLQHTFQIVYTSTSAQYMTDIIEVPIFSDALLHHGLLSRFIKCHIFNLCTFSTHSFQKHVNILVCRHCLIQPRIIFSQSRHLYQSPYGFPDETPDSQSPVHPCVEYPL